MLGMRIAIAVVGLIAIAALLRGVMGDEAGDLSAVSERVMALTQALADEKQARATLQDEVGQLRAELGQSQAPSRTAPAPVSAPAPAPVAKPLAAADPPRSAAFDPQQLVAAGFSTSDVERFQERVSAIELERLYLRDQAQREGWLRSPRFAAESQRLAQELAGLRGEFDEGLYDWMVFAQGRPNRVSVTEVLPGSAADSAGLRTGDLIVRYDERLVLSPDELGVATGAGKAGAQVELELQRGGETMRVFLPRGPIGVKLEPRSVAPSSSG